MIGVAVLFLASWLLLRLEGKGLDALGLNQPARRFSEFCVALVIMGTASVLGEELLFRGYLLYQALRFAGRTAGLLISAAAFGVYHWFSWGVFGNIPAMGMVFLFTGAFGFVAALAFRQTGSLAAPVGLHLGWNLVFNGVFSSGPSGKTMLLPSAGTLPLQAGGVAGLLVGFVLPLAFLAAVSWLLLRYRSPIQTAAA